MATRVKGARHLRPSERAILKQSAVFACEGHTLRHGLIDDGIANLRETPHVGFARSEVATSYGVAKEAADAVAVVLIVLGRVDSALGRDAVRPARAVLEAEAVHLVPETAEGRRGRSARQTTAHDDDSMTLSIRGRDQSERFATAGPFFRQCSVGDTRFEFHGEVSSAARATASTPSEPLPTPMKTRVGRSRLPTMTISTSP